MRREIERAVEGYERREGFAELAMAVVGLFVWVGRGIFRAVVSVARHVRVQLQIKTVRATYVGGPMRIGDEHPTLKGWFYTGKRDRYGVLLWYRPPGPVSRWVRRIGMTAYLVMMAFAIIVACIFGHK